MVESSNLLENIFSALNPLIIFKPPNVSSKRDKKYPCSLCTLSLWLFRDFPIYEIRKPETGINIKTNKVSSGLIASMAIMVNKIISGSLTISSSIDKKECCTSSTSLVILAMVSPFLFSE